MRYVLQMGIIMVISFVGEILSYCLPFPVPASIYGMALLFGLLYFRILPLHAVRASGRFLIEIMPLMFLPAAVGLIDAWEVVRVDLTAYMVIIAVSTFAVMLLAGHATQAVMRWRGGK